MDTSSSFCFLVPCAQGHSKLPPYRFMMICGRQFCMQVYARLGSVLSSLCLFCGSFIELSVLLLHGMSLKGDVTADIVQEYK